MVFHCQRRDVASEPVTELQYLLILLASLRQQFAYLAAVTVESFRPEIDQALSAYGKYVICIDKTPEDFEESLQSLLSKAIKAYETREPHLRHGIALDRHVTVILSKGEASRPLCGIYFNLHSPYQKSAPVRSIKPKAQQSIENS